MAVPQKRRKIYYKIVRRVDDLRRIVVPKEITRTLKIREGNPVHTPLTSFDLFLSGIVGFAQRITRKYSEWKQPPIIRTAAVLTVKQNGFAILK